MAELAAHLTIELRHFPPKIDGGGDHVAVGEMLQSSPLPADPESSSSSDESISELEDCSHQRPLCRVCVSKQSKRLHFCISCGHPQIPRSYHHGSKPLCYTCGKNGSKSVDFCLCCGFPLYLKDGEVESMAPRNSGKPIIDEPKYDPDSKRLGYGWMDCIVG